MERLEPLPPGLVSTQYNAVMVAFGKRMEGNKAETPRNFQGILHFNRNFTLNTSFRVHGCLLHPPSVLRLLPTRAPTKTLRGLMDLERFYAFNPITGRAAYDAMKNDRSNLVLQSSKKQASIPFVGFGIQLSRAAKRLAQPDCNRGEGYLTSHHKWGWKVV